MLDEERRSLPIGLHLLGLGRHQHAHELARFLEAGLALDPDLVDVLVVEVADGPLHQVLFLIDEGGSDRVEGGVADVLPEAQEIFVVALDLGLGALGARGADDQTHAFRHFQALHHALQALAVGGRGDLAADAAAARGVGHQHAVAAGQGQVGGERRALVAALFLDDLDQHDLPAADHFLDLVATHQPPTTPGDLFFHDVVFVAFEFLVLVVGSAHAAFGDVVFLVSLFAQQGFAVGDGDLVIVGVDFVEGEEAVAVAAVLDEGRLQRRLNARHLGEIDIPSELFAVLALEIELFNTGPIDHHDTRLFGVCGVDQHLLGHKKRLRGAPRTLGSGAAGLSGGRARHRPSQSRNRQCGR